MWGCGRMGVGYMRWELRMDMTLWDLQDQWVTNYKSHWSYTSYLLAADRAFFLRPHAETPIRPHVLFQPRGQIFGPVGDHHISTGPSKAGHYL